MVSLKAFYTQFYVWYAKVDAFPVAIVTSQKYVRRSALKLTLIKLGIIYQIIKILSNKFAELMVIDRV